MGPGLFLQRGSSTARGAVGVAVTGGSAYTCNPATLDGTRSPACSRRSAPPVPSRQAGFSSSKRGHQFSVAEAMTTSLYLEEERDIGRYETGFNHLRADALDAEESLAFIRRLIED